MTSNEKDAKELQKEREAKYDAEMAEARIARALLRYELLSSGYWTRGWHGVVSP